MEGLEISIIPYANLQNGVETLRFDSEYYLKEYMRIEKFISNNKLLFNRFSDWQIDIDCSAFYPAIEPFYGEGNIPLIRVQNVKDVIDYNSCVRIPQLSNEQFATLKTVIPGDIVITKGGSIGFIGYITQEAYACRDLIFIKSSALLEEQRVFLYLYLLTDFAYKQLIRSSSQCAQPHLTITLVKNLDIFNGSSMLMQKCTKIYSDFRQKYLASLDLYRKAEELLLGELQIPDLAQQSNNVIYCRYSDFVNSGRLDAEYYQPKYNILKDKLRSYKYGYYNLSEIAKTYRGDLISDTLYTTDDTGVAYIRGADISSNILTSEKCVYIDRTFIATKEIRCKTNDLVFALIGSVGTVARVTDNFSGSFISNNLGLIRLNSDADISAEYLHLLLTSPQIGKWLFEQKEMKTAQPKISDKDIFDFIIPKLDRKIQQQIGNKVNESFALRKESHRLLNLAKTAVETAIEKGEATAIKLLDI